MSDEKKGNVHHVYDGIEEEDNRLPNWWLGILFGTTIFAFGYWMYFEVAHADPGPRGEYAEAMDAFKKAHAAPGAIDDGALAALAKNDDVVKGGAQVFAQNCATCHGPQAQGVIGPNLTDNFWIHGGKPGDIQKTITTGVLEKGMPAWGPVLGAERVKSVTAFVLAQRGKNLPGKPPQGDPVTQ